MTKQDIDTINNSQCVKSGCSDSAAYANNLMFEAALMDDDVLGFKAAKQAESDLMADIVAYRRLAENLLGGSY